MPLNKGNGVLVGEICESCIHLRPADGILPCPHGNSEHPDKKTLFVGANGTPGSLCYSYVTYDDIGVEAKMKSFKKEASKMTESELNVELYRKLSAMPEKERKHFKKYWVHIYPEQYAEEMTSDKVETTPKKKDKTKKRKNQFSD